VLVVEDERDIAALVRHALERTGEMAVRSVESGEQAVRAAADRAPDLVVLDVNLPALNGFEVCRILRGRSETAAVPIIILTARATETDRILGLDLGADDYMIKPFSLGELVARVRAVLRRARRGDVTSRLYERGPLAIDFNAVDVKVNGRPVPLARREFELLRYLIERRGRVVSRSRLLEQVWGYDASIETRSVDVHINRLRAKLGPAAQLIETVIGFGYRFSERDELSAQSAS
jgi:DNA-binding response OmpR family regulator